MFYENERIVRKHQKYLKLKAEELIDWFRQKGLTDDEIIECLELSLNASQDENHEIEYINKALQLLKLHKGVSDV